MSSLPGEKTVMKAKTFGRRPRPEVFEPIAQLASQYQRTHEGDLLLVEYLQGSAQSQPLKLDLTESPFSFESAGESVRQELMFAIRVNTRLEEINLSSMALSAGVMNALSNSFATVTTVILRKVNMSSSLLRVLSSHLEGDKSTVTLLDISENPNVGPKSFLAQALMNNHRLKELRANDTGIWDLMWKRFLQFNHTLRIISMDKTSPLYDLLQSFAFLNDVLAKLAAKEVTRREFHHHITTYHPEMFLKAIKSRHIAGVHAMLNRGLIMSELPSIGPSNAPLRIALMLGDAPLLSLLLTGGGEVTPELFELGGNVENNGDLLDILNRAQKHEVYLVDGTVRFILDHLPPDTESVVLSGNDMDEIPSQLMMSLTKLTRLTSLDLSHNRLISLPPELGQLQSLRVLKLNHNPLASFPDSASELKALRVLELTETPFESIPEDVQKKGVAKIIAYLLEIHAPTKMWNRLKLVVVGEENVGKTHLINCLNKREYPKNVSTDGIEVESLTFSKRIRFLTYDFGGQEVFYPTHQFFLSDRALYIVVFKLSSDNHSRCVNWLKKVRSLGGLVPPPVLIVGTHLDDAKVTPTRLAEMEVLVKRWKKSYPNIQGHVFVSCRTSENVKELRTMLDTVASKQRIVTKLVSQAYLNMDRMLEQVKTKRQVISWDKYEKLAQKVHIYSRDELVKMTKFLHDVGSLLWFDTPGLQQVVIFDVKWLADVMSSIISFKVNWTDGLLPHKTLEVIWRQFPPDLHATLLNLLRKFEVIFPYHGGDEVSVVPSLLPLEPSPQFNEFTLRLKNDVVGASIITRMYHFDQLPLGFFARLIARMFQGRGMMCHNADRNGFLVSPFSEDAPPPGTPEFSEYVDSLFAEDASLASVSLLGESAVIITLWKPRQDHSAFFLDLLMVLENLISEVYAKYQESIRRQCSFMNYSHYVSMTFEELLEVVRADGSSFVPASKIQPLQPTPNSPSSPPPPSASVNIPGASSLEQLIAPDANDDSDYQISISALAPDITLTFTPTISPDDVELLQELGRGGCGIVYEGRLKRGDGEPPLRVAVKQLHSAHLVAEPELQLESQLSQFFEFQKEVFMMSNLKSRYLVELLGVQQKPLAMLLEYVPGRDLSQVLSDRSLSFDMFGWDLRRKIALDIARGVHYLHTCVTPPIIHRDLRSPNCFILTLAADAAGHIVNCKVADFGLAQRLYVTSSERLLTWQWMAPEVLDERNPSYGEMMDVFSYGTIMWELVTRQFPYDEYAEFFTERRETLSVTRRKNLVEMESMRSSGWTVDLKAGVATKLIAQTGKFIDAIIQKDLRPSIPTDTPKDIANLIRRCWIRDPNLRPPMSEIVDILKGSLANWRHTVMLKKTVSSHPTPPPTPPPRAPSGRTAITRSPSAPSLRSSATITRSRGVSVPHLAVLHTELEAPESSGLVMVKQEETIWAGCVNGNIALYDFASGRKLHEFAAHKSKVTALCVTPKNVVSCGDDGMVYFWALKKVGKSKPFNKTPVAVVNCVSLVHPELRAKAAKKEPLVWMGNTDGTVYAWRGKERVRRLSVTGSISDLFPVPLPDGKHQLWVGTRDCLYVMENHQQQLSLLGKFPCKVKKFCYVGNQVLWSCGESSGVSVWNLQTIKKMSTPLLVLPTVTNLVVAHSRELGRCVVATAVDGNAYVISPERYVVLGSFPALSPDVPSVLSSLESSQLWTFSSNKLRRWYL